jgi:hypothetical protein
MIDTGSGSTILDDSLNPELGRRLGTDSVAYPGIKRARVGVYQAELYLGDFPLLPSKRVLTAPRKGVSIVGMDCLKKYCLQLDFAERKVRLLDPQRADSEYPGQAFAISISPWSGYVVLHETLVGREARWVLDTGGCGVDALLNPHLFRRVLNQEHLAPESMRLNGIATRGINVPEGTFAGRSYNDLLLGEVRHNIWPGAPNVLALRFLERHLVTFNFPKGVLYLRARMDASKAERSQAPARE